MTQARQPGANRLTYSQLLSEDCPFTQGWAVPPAVAELVLTLIDAQLCPFTDDNDSIGATLAEGSLTGCQPRYLVADDVCTQSYHRGQCPRQTERGRDERDEQDG